MTTFNIGDRVRVVNDTHIPEYNGVTGSVQHDDGATMWPLRVVFDEPVEERGGVEADIFDPAEIELIDPPTTAATLRSRADELTAKAEDNREELRKLQERVNDLDREAWRLNGLAAQYRAVADDLEAQK